MTEILLFVLTLDIQLLRGERWMEPISRSNSSTFCVFTKLGQGFPLSYVVISLYVQ